MLLLLWCTDIFLRGERIDGDKAVVGDCTVLLDPGLELVLTGVLTMNFRLALSLAQGEVGRSVSTWSTSAADASVSSVKSLMVDDDRIAVGFATLAAADDGRLAAGVATTLLRDRGAALAALLRVEFPEAAAGGPELRCAEVMAEAQSLLAPIAFRRGTASGRVAGSEDTMGDDGLSVLALQGRTRPHVVLIHPSSCPMEHAAVLLSCLSRSALRRSFCSLSGARCSINCDRR